MHASNKAIQCCVCYILIMALDAGAMWSGIKEGPIAGIINIHFFRAVLFTKPLAFSCTAIVKFKEPNTQKLRKAGTNFLLQ